ncbi:hypothetical protein PMIN06_004884 [Paraphaeosphaeria minitans]|uniref:Uncharacterized protein n=1 Tax=Paraphaeosphaeria minitans TaxID=565426 RepID=A0A9P6GSP1_9PLEO|nr:hypothetical protein PMIN01_02469 [Paraphaeosphaeria minitans]
MPRIAMWDWIHSVPEETCRSHNHSFSSPAEHVHHTIFAELHEFALKNAKAAYESLPHHLLLQFERIDPDTLALFSQKADVNESRLLLGLSKDSCRGEFTPAYAYISKKNHAHQVLLKLGHNHLKVNDLDSVEWEKPFDSIYDAYGQTDRSGDRMCMMAAYYFLAADHISEIATRTRSFMQHFAKLCGNIYVQTAAEIRLREVSAPEPIDGPLVGQTLPSNRMSRSLCQQDRASDLLLPETQQQNRKQESDDDIFKTRQDTSDAQLIPLTYQVNDKGDLSLVSPINGDSPRISSPTVWDGPNGSPVTQLPRSNTNLLIDLVSPPTGQHQVKLQDLEAAGQPDFPESKALGIDDLATFVERFKELEAQSTRLREHNIANAELEVIVTQSKNDAKRGYTKLQELQERFLNQETELKGLRKELARTKRDSATANQKLTHDLGQEQSKLQSLQRARAHIQTCLDGVQVENKQLERRLAEAERSGTPKQKVVIMEASLRALEADKKGMQDRIRILEDEVQVEKNKFNDYKRMIRNLSLDP